MNRTMKKESPKLAVVSHNTFKATKSANLHHYDISSALQTTLEFSELIGIFSEKIKKMIPHDGVVYTNEDFELKVAKGMSTKYSCTYVLKVEEMGLGVLKIMRRQNFDENEVKQLENLLCCLIYPLKNATLYKQAISLAHTDTLTQTYNRTAFDDSLMREMRLADRKSNPLSVIFFDIDHFKEINDNYGHEGGDVVLASAASCIKDALRASDIVFRYGGEEFVILLNDTPLEGAKIIAERIRESLENHTVAYGMELVKITASLGISALRGNDTSEMLIRRADEAMYRAKAKGRNQVQIELSAQLV